MATPRRKVYIKELVEDDHSETDHAFINLRKHLKSGTGSPYQAKPNFITAILDRDGKTEAAASENKALQWRIMGLAVALFFAVTAAVALTHSLSATLLFKGILSGCAAVSLALVLVAAIAMLDRTRMDLDFIREHGKLNEEMLNLTLGLQKLVNDTVASRRPEFRIRCDYAGNAYMERKAVIPWLYGICSGSFAFALLVCGALIWM
jgi:hypothetical protein